jgi:hypothetical protein
MVDELVLVGRPERAARDAFKPGERRWVEVGHGREDRADGDIGQGAPPGKAGRDFTAHEAATNDSNTDVVHHKKFFRNPPSDGSDFHRSKETLKKHLRHLFHLRITAFPSPYQRKAFH